jgi:hypothetical protein
MDGSFPILHFKIIFMDIQNCFGLLNCYHVIELHLQYTILFIKNTWFLLVPSPMKIKDLLHKNLKKGDWGNNMKLGQKECKENNAKLTQK